MEKLYISLGSNCAVAYSLERLGKRTVSLPLDWLFTYHSIHKIFENDFKDFVKITKTSCGMHRKIHLWPDEIVNDPLEHNSEYNTFFLHREKEKDPDSYEETIQRRVDRLLEILKAQDKEIVFIRRGHFRYYHKVLSEVREVKFTHFEDAPNERESMELLVEVLRKKYPLLKFKIHLFYNCRCKLFENCDTEYLRTKHIPMYGGKPEDDHLLDEELKLL